MHSHEAEGQSQVIISCHYGNSCLNTGNTRRRGVLIKKREEHIKKVLFCMPSSQLVHRNQHCGNKLFCFPFLHPFPRLCRQLKWLWDSKSFQTRWVQDIFWMLYFPFPWFFRPLCVGAAKSFASYQLLSNSLQQYPMKGNSESDVIVTTTCIGVIKCSCGVSKKTKQNAKLNFSHGVETTLSPL